MSLSLGLAAADQERDTTPELKLKPKFDGLGNVLYFVDVCFGVYPRLNSSVTIMLDGVPALGSSSVPFTTLTATTLEGFVNVAPVLLNNALAHDLNKLFL